MIFTALDNLLKNGSGVNISVDKHDNLLIVDIQPKINSNTKATDIIIGLQSTDTGELHDHELHKKIHTLASKEKSLDSKIDSMRNTLADSEPIEDRPKPKGNVDLF